MKNTNKGFTHGGRGLFLGLFVLLQGLACASALAASLQDGPYVSRSADGAWVARWVEGDDSAPKVTSENVRVGQEVTVPAAGSVPAFKVKLREPVRTPVAAEVALPAGAPLFVMADTHGELEIAVELLQRQKVIDSKLAWSFGKGHLAVLGDIFDRGPHQTEIVWLLYKLEGEARRAGGAVHVLIGNHESIALSGDERYLHPRYPRVARALGAARYSELWNEQSLLGQWLRSRPAVMKIGDYLCLHGGISPEVVRRKLTLARLNDSVRAALGRPGADDYANGPEGPLWYRGYFPEVARQNRTPVATQAEVDEVLGYFGAQGIFVGHTRVPTVTPLYGGRVMAVQVYPRRDEAGRAVMEGLRVERGRFFRASIDGSVQPLDSPTRP